MFFCVTLRYSGIGAAVGLSRRFFVDILRIAAKHLSHHGMRKAENEQEKTTGKSS